MKNYLITFFLLAAVSTIKGQLTGTAFLQGQTNHSGIRVKFTATGGTAVTDSAFTTASGAYSITIAPGVYSIAFAKTGYLDGFYNNGATYVLTNTTVLSGMTIIPGNALFVSGAVSGTWSNSHVYIVTGDLTISSGSTLSIQPGTKVLFNGDYAITGGGVIKALGTSGNPVLFSSNRQSPARGDWNQIGLTSNSSVFDNCIFEYATWALNFHSGSANVTNSIVRHGVTSGVYMGAGTPLVENNEVYDMSASSSDASIGIWLEGSSSGTISCNYIHDIHSGGWNSYGIIHSSSLVRDNRINNITGPTPKGIQSRYAGARNINNCISNSGIGIDIDGSWQAANPIIANNILFANESGIRISCGSTPLSPTIVNNLITGNTNGITESGSTGGTVTIDHNLMWNNSGSDYSSVQLVGLGQMVSTNSAGYQVDSYFNMSQDPLYNSAPLLSASSPCYGTGNTAYSSQIGFSNPQACKGTIVSIREQNNIARISVFPNPSSGMFSVSADTGDELAISIFDMNGRLVHSSKVTPGQQVNANDLSNGVYIFSVKKGDVTGKTLLVISK